MMAVVCPTNNIGQLSKPTTARTRSYTPRRRKDYSKPLHVDCSVEYELPNSAKPPAGNKSEPLLMIHPSFYRREESKHRNHFINNLPKRRSNNRYCRSTTATNRCNLSNSNLGVTCVTTRSQDKRAPEQSTPKQSVHKSESCFQLTADRHCERYSQSTTASSYDSSTSKVPPPQMDLISFWKRTIETNTLLQTASSLEYSDIQAQSDKVVHMMPIPELAAVPDPSSARILDTWLSSCHDVNAATNSNKNDNKQSNSDKYSTCKTRDRSKKNYMSLDNCIAATPSKGTSAKPNSMSLSVVVTAPNSTAVLANCGVVAPIKQQQPAVGVAAIAPLNCNGCCPSSRPTLKGGLIRQQPWNAQTAAEFPPPSLPISTLVQKRSMLLPPMESTFNDCTASVLKRTADDVTWWSDAVSDDPMLAKKSRLIVDENARFENSQWFGKNVAMAGDFTSQSTLSNCCKAYYPVEQSCCNYPSNCGISSNQPASCSSIAWNRPSENLNTLNLFRL